MRTEVIIPFFNPCRYKKPVENLIRSLTAHAYPTTVVELVYDDDEPLDLEYLAANHIIVRGSRDRHVAWQKEALINHAAAMSVKPYLCWCDADILFSDQDWLIKTERLLDVHKVVQPFTSVQCYDMEYDPRIFPSFAATYKIRLNPTWHAKPGYSLAWRSHIGPIPDVAICGGGDRLMLNAVTGWWDHPMFDSLSPIWKQEAMKQCFPVNMECQADIGCTQGMLRYFPHGSHDNRKYNERFHILRRLGFDPRKHIVKEGPLWTWTDPRFNDAMLQYFKGRREDD